jgi:hypothetical protein
MESQWCGPGHLPAAAGGSYARLPDMHPVGNMCNEMARYISNFLPATSWAAAVGVCSAGPRYNMNMRIPSNPPVDTKTSR